MKAIQIRNYIKGTSKLNRTGLLSVFAFLLLALACLYPLSKSEQTTEAVTGTAQSSSLTLDVTSASASVDLEVSSTNGTFAASNVDAAFSVSTNNFSGYTLSIVGSDDNGLLLSTDGAATLSSLTEATTEASFSAAEGTALNGKWGYKPSKLNSQVNTNYLPAPTTTASTLDVTAAANNTANSYTVALGARTDYNTPSATYNNAFTVTAVSNPINYVITYDANTEETVTNMPSTQSGSVSTTNIALANNTPVRDGYDFLGWCTVAPAESTPDACSGTTFQPNGAFGIDQTTNNITTLYAMWQKRLSLTVTAGSGISSVTGSGTYAPGEVVTITATPLPTANCLQYGTPSWSLGSGTTGTLSSTSGTSVTYTMGTTNDTITVSSASSAATSGTATINFATSTGAKQIVLVKSSSDQGTTYTNGTSASLTCGTTYTLAGTFNSGYAFSGWSANTGTFDSTSSTTMLGTKYKVEGPATITLTGKSIPTAGYIQDFTNSMCSSQASSGPVQVTDRRDSKTYTVQYINGACWMTQNLRLAAGTTVTSTYSNVSSSYTLPAESTSNFSSSTGYTTGGIKCSNNEATGCWYNYVAATAGTITTNSNDTEAAYDICPKGWKLPTNTQNSGIKSYKSAFSPVYGGYWRSGSLGTATTLGYWWSSTASSTSYRYRLFYDGGSLRTTNSYRYRGYYVRCVRQPDPTISTVTNMQDVTAEVCAASAEGETATLLDTRTDGTGTQRSYNVAKINGICTMIDNLALDPGDTGIALTTEDSNVDENRTLEAKTKTNFTSSTIGDTGKTGYDLQGTWCGDNAKTGNYECYYNYAAATAGTITGSSNQTEAVEDICPKGWRLPTGKQNDDASTTSIKENEQFLINDSYAWQSYNPAYKPATTSTTPGPEPFSPVAAGVYYNGSLYNSGSGGSWWSSSANSATSRYSLYYNTSDGLYSGGSNSRYSGVSVRCVLGPRA